MARSKVTLTASTKAIDPTLNALFTSSAGPIKAPSTTRYSGLLPPKEKKPAEQGDTPAHPDEDDEDANEEDDESLSEIEGADYEDYDETEEAEDGEEAEGSSSENEASESATEPSVHAKKERKRKRKDEHDDLEANYMRKIAVEEEKEERDARAGKRRKGEAGEAVDGASTEAVEPEDDVPIIHESLLKKTEEHGDVDLDKANRTLFLGNISIEAITSSKAKKTLMSHISAPLEGLDASAEPQKVESLRFRSTPFSTGSMPKRAAYITKSVMDATAKSTNAYAVYSTPLAARTALKALNGTVVLDRHLRADSVAHPTPTAHRRCVFVGNLGFVDDETVINTTAEGETTTKKRNKVPSDIEEGLWRVFGSKAGKVESVRVPRDPKTRVGKGFAYVQFYDGNDVEAALLLNEKKFPPMLPRVLRVSRAKDPRKTALAVERSTKTKPEAYGGEGKLKSTKYKFKATPEQQSLAGRAGRLLGRSAAARQKHGLNGESKKPRTRVARPVNNTEMKTPEQIVFEGRRASSTDGKPRDLKFGKSKKKSAVKPKGRGAKRAADWRNKGSK
ncbi:Nucleolar protein 12 [Diatrype stigma]|uniref:Nucleolar protein 12 n=1 Tax=Diatrype stigma TaxID=117547 RepID=A0AAN9V1B1_9PEZI